MAFQLPHHFHCTSMIPEINCETGKTTIELGYECSGMSINVLLSHDTPPGFDKSPHTVEAEYISRYDKAEYWSDDATGPENAIARLDIAEKEVQDFVGKLCLPTLLELASSPNENKTSDESGSRSRSLYDHLYPKAINLQIVTERGNPKVIRRDDLPPKRLIQPSADVTTIATYLPTQITILEEFREWVLKVSIDNQILCCKMNLNVQDSFLREYQWIQRVAHASGTIKVPKIVGLVKGEQEDKEAVIGILMEYVEAEIPDLGLTLRNDLHNEISLHRRSRWAAQVEDIISQLPNIGVVWRDAKTGNILIDKDDNAWLLDFGGGQTAGWIDKKEICRDLRKSRRLYDLI